MSVNFGLFHNKFYFLWQMLNDTQYGNVVNFHKSYNCRKFCRKFRGQFVEINYLKAFT